MSIAEIIDSESGELVQTFQNVFAIDTISGKYINIWYYYNIDGQKRDMRCYRYYICNETWLNIGTGI